MKHHYLKEEDFYSHLNMEDITDCAHEACKKACKDFHIKYLEEFHDLYVQRDELLLAHVFEIFQKLVPQSLNHGLVLKNVDRAIKLTQKAWLKPYIDINTDLRKKKQKWLWESLLQADE